MYVIETDLGRFEGENEKDAKKKLRAAERKEKERIEKIAQDYKIAELRARSEAYNMLSQKADEKQMPHGWRCLPVTDQSYSCRWVCGSIPDHTATYSIETNDGRIERKNLYEGITHFVENGAGFCMGVSFGAHQDYEIFAVGICGEEAVFMPVPGVKRDDFDREPPSTTAVDALQQIEDELAVENAIQKSESSS